MNKTKTRPAARRHNQPSAPSSTEPQKTIPVVGQPAMEAPAARDPLKLGELENIEQGTRKTLDNKLCGHDRARADIRPFHSDPEEVQSVVDRIARSYLDDGWSVSVDQPDMASSRMNYSIIVQSVPRADAQIQSEVSDRKITIISAIVFLGLSIASFAIAGALASRFSWENAINGGSPIPEADWTSWSIILWILAFLGFVFSTACGILACTTSAKRFLLAARAKPGNTIMFPASETPYTAPVLHVSRPRIKAILRTTLPTQAVPAIHGKQAS